MYAVTCTTLLLVILTAASSPALTLKTFLKIGFALSAV